VSRHNPFLVVCLLISGAAAAQVPSVQRAPIAEYREATFLGATTCRPDPAFEYCSKPSDRFYTILLDGRQYVLRSGPNDSEILAMIGAAMTPVNRSDSLPGKNVLATLAPDTNVEVRFHGGGFDVRVLSKSAKRARYSATHYEIAVSRLDRLYHHGPDLN